MMFPLVLPKSWGTFSKPSLPMEMLRRKPMHMFDFGYPKRVG